jgi:hypothetical protein
MIIGLCGAQGAGKDTVGGILESKHGFVKLAFASAIKDVLSALFSWPRDMLEGLTKESREWRETPNEYWSAKLAIPDFTPRKAMQIVGTDLLRNQLNKDVWINIIENKIMMLRESDPNVNIVITDCRFANEFDMIQKISESRIIKIVKDQHVKPFRIEDVKSNGSNPVTLNEKWCKMTATHSSENDWTNIDCEILQNNGSIESLEFDINTMIYSSLSASSS